MTKKTTTKKRKKRKKTTTTTNIFSLIKLLKKSVFHRNFLDQKNFWPKFNLGLIFENKIQKWKRGIISDNILSNNKKQKLLNKVPSKMSFLAASCRLVCDISSFLTKQLSWWVVLSLQVLNLVKVSLVLLSKACIKDTMGKSLRR